MVVLVLRYTLLKPPFNRVRFKFVVVVGGCSTGTEPVAEISHYWTLLVKSLLMPPKKKVQSSVSKEICCVCCQPVAKEKDESLFCGRD